MGDKILVEFPVGDTGHAVTVGRPSEGQILVLAMAARSSRHTDNFQTIGRVVRVAESLLGPDQWPLFEDRMIDGSVTVRDFLSLIESVLSFNWSAHEGKEDQEPVAPSPAQTPRVVRGG
jgi:hypothetical protein